MQNNFLPAISFQIRNADTFWDWTKKYLVPAMYGVKWYNGRAFEYKDGFISDMSGYLVGMPRFRQLRVKPGECNENILDPQLTLKTAERLLHV